MGMNMGMEVKRERERERSGRRRRNSQPGGRKLDEADRRLDHSLIGWQTVVGTSPSPTQFRFVFRLLPPLHSWTGTGTGTRGWGIPAFMRSKHGLPRFLSLSLSVFGI